MTTTEMRRAACKRGYWWTNTAPLGETPDWREAPMPPDCSANSFTIFGYEESEFLAKQYKKARGEP